MAATGQAVNSDTLVNKPSPGDPVFHPLKQRVEIAGSDVLLVPSLRGMGRDNLAVLTLALPHRAQRGHPTPPFDLQNTPVCQQPGLPRVVVAFEPILGMPAVTADNESITNRAGEHFQTKGLRRPGILG